MGLTDSPSSPVPEGTAVEDTEGQPPPLPRLPPLIDWDWEPVTVIPDSQPEEEAEWVRI
jgi:hypothetical protein